MKRLILHWTAGKYSPNACDLEHYHYLVDGCGEIFKGKYKPEDNIDCTDENYARHTGGGNTNSIGVAICGMLGFKNERNVGNYPITLVQFERTMKLCAEILNKYGLSPNSLLTHYEFGQAHPTTTSYGKIDIIHIPPYPAVTRHEVGNFIRSKVKWYKDKYNSIIK